MHPFADAEGQLTEGARYEEIEREYGWAVRRQLVGALQVHVAVGGADRTLAVYNGLRWPPARARRVASAAPFYEGVDTGLASVRPAISTMLPRQGLPPEIPSWDDLAQALELHRRPAPLVVRAAPRQLYGTLELRVPDTQPRIEDAAAVAAYAHALVAWLSARHDDGEELKTAPTWLRSSSAGSPRVEGVQRTGDRATVAGRIDELLPSPHARVRGGAERARELCERNAAVDLR